MRMLNQCCLRYFLAICLTLLAADVSLALTPQESRQKFWTEAKRKEMFERKYDPSTWDMEMFREDMEGHKNNKRPVKSSSSNFPSPVPKYSNFGGAIAWPSFELDQKTIRGVMFSWGKYDVNKHLAVNESHNLICYFNLFVLTDLEQKDKAIDMASRNYPHVLSTGKQKTSVGDVDWVHVGMADGNNLAIINQRIFDLKFGKTVLVAPQRDGSLRFMQREAPASYDFYDENYQKEFLRELRSDPDVVEFFTNVNTIGPPVQDDKSACRLPQLRDELNRRAKEDQDARFAMMNNKTEGEAGVKERSELIQRLKKIDEENTAWLSKQVDKHGWPGRSLVGKKGAQNAWLLVQHADHDRKFQKRCLELMNKLPKGEISPTHLAYLTDRVRVADGKPQMYGTQISYKDGKSVPQNIEDPENLNKRRAAIGLEPIEDYLKAIESMNSGG